MALALAINEEELNASAGGRSKKHLRQQARENLSTEGRGKVRTVSSSLMSSSSSSLPSSSFVEAVSPNTRQVQADKREEEYEEAIRADWEVEAAEELKIYIFSCSYLFFFFNVFYSMIFFYPSV